MVAGARVGRLTGGPESRGAARYSTAVGVMPERLWLALLLPRDIGTLDLGS